MNSTDLFLGQLTTNLGHFNEFLVHLAYHINGLYAFCFAILFEIIIMIGLIDLYICCILICGMRPWEYKKKKIELMEKNKNTRREKKGKKKEKKEENKKND